MRLHLVDGTFELFRAHFSRRPEHLGPDGRRLKATVGLADSLLALLGDSREAVTHLAVAFDNPIRSFRNELFAGYKTEEGVDPVLLAQFDEAERATEALGVTVWSMDRFEADDAMATAATRWSEQVEQVRILTPDKDLGQCLKSRHVVQVDRIRGVEIDEDALRARRGVGPASIPDFLGLVGDDADGIPGVPGFGEKTASKLLARYEHLEAIPDDASKWPDGIRGAPALAATLAQHRGDATLWRKLATLVRDVPLPQSLEDLRWRGVPAGFDTWCASVASNTLASRPRPAPR